MPKGFDNVSLFVVDIFSDYVVSDIQFTNKHVGLLTLSFLAIEFMAIYFIGCLWSVSLLIFPWL